MRKVTWPSFRLGSLTRMLPNLTWVVPKCWVSATASTQHTRIHQLEVQQSRGYAPHTNSESQKSSID